MVRLTSIYSPYLSHTLLMLHLSLGSKAYVAQAIDASIARMGTTPDAWLLHRIDKTMYVSLDISLSLIWS